MWDNKIRCRKNRTRRVIPTFAGASCHVTPLQAPKVAVLDLGYVQLLYAAWRAASLKTQYAIPNRASAVTMPTSALINWHATSPSW